MVGGCAWQGDMCGGGACGGVSRHAWWGVMHGRGCAWPGACMVDVGRTWQERRPLQWAVRILLECILEACSSYFCNLTSVFTLNESERENDVKHRIGC